MTLSLVSTSPAPPELDGVAEVRARASIPLPRLRPIPDFVGMPTGDPSLTDDSTFLVAQGAALGWLAVCVVASLLVGGGLAAMLSWPIALLLFALFVWLPAYLAAFRYAALVLADPPGLSVVRPATPVTVVVSGSAAPSSTGSTLAYLAAQDYAGPVRVLLVGGRLSDEDARAVRQAAQRLDLDLGVVRGGWVDAAEVCNLALPYVASRLVLTLQPGACLHPSAVRLLAARLESEPPDTAAVSGRAFVRNRRDRATAEVLALDYAGEVDATQRLESLFGGARVAGAACTLYRAAALRAVNGLPSVEAAEVAGAWQFVDRGWRVAHEPRAIAFVTESVTLGTLGRSGARAARGLGDGVRATGGVDRRHPAGVRLLAALARSGPARDVVVVVTTVPAVALLVLGQFALVAGYLVLVVPVALAAAGVARRAERDVLDEAGLAIPRRGFDAVAPLLGLPVVQAPASLAEALRRGPARPGRSPNRLSLRRRPARRAPRYA